MPFECHLNEFVEGLSWLDSVSMLLHEAAGTLLSGSVYCA